MTRKIDVSLISANNISSNNILVVQNSNVVYSDISSFLVGYSTNAQLSAYALNADLTTSNVQELNNLYFTNARSYSNIINIGFATNANVDLKANIADLTTSNVLEVNNLYFTNARVRTAITSGNGIIYDNTVGNITLSATGVIASTYGNATIIPVFTVDSYGRISNVANIALTATGGASVTVQNTSPSASTQGTFWLDSDTLDLYVSYSNVWVMVNGSSVPIDVVSPLLLPGM